MPAPKQPAIISTAASFPTKAHKQVCLDQVLAAMLADQSQSLCLEDTRIRFSDRMQEIPQPSGTRKSTRRLRAHGPRGTPPAAPPRQSSDGRSAGCGHASSHKLAHIKRQWSGHLVTSCWAMSISRSFVYPARAATMSASFQHLP